MDLNQRKLTKNEWETIETPVSQQEKEVLNLIIQGYHNVNIKYNRYHSLFQYLKIEYNEPMEDYLYNKYFSPKLNEIKKNYPAILCVFQLITAKNNPTIKKADLIRLEKNDASKLNSDIAYEYLLIDTVEQLIKYKEKRSSKWLFHYFTLSKLIKNTITNLNRHVLFFMNQILTLYEDEVDLTRVIENSVDFIEKNSIILKYADISLYDHQKQLFAVMKNPEFEERQSSFRTELKQSEKLNSCENDDSDDDLTKPLQSTEKKAPPPRLVLYIAPTGTGKTLSPIGISEKNRVIFVCAARHVGLALARAAISVGKKIAFAFGCASADDIRLHYFAAKEFTVNKRDGRIKKVDNSVGDKVEIIICDVKSYLPAMYYMKAFNPVENIVVYWDEPTITLDYENHDLHETIQKNWNDNLIPNMILSSATLPKLHELKETLEDFKDKFPSAQIVNIVSHDCKKTIPIINNNGYVVLPHFISTEYNKVLEIVDNCENNLTLLRYFDLKEVVDFILFVEKNNYVIHSHKIARNFACIDDVNMQSIKLHYLRCLKHIIAGSWGSIYMSLKTNRIRRIENNYTIDPKGNSIKKSTSIGPGLASHNSGSGTGGAPITKSISEQFADKPQAAATDSTSSNVGGNSCAIYVSTKDAYTLTDGPTLFLAEDVEKIAKFCIQQANIPAKVMEDIIEKIDFNNRVNEKIVVLEHKLEDLIEKKTMKQQSSDDSYAAKKLKSEPKIRDKEIGEKDGEIIKLNSELTVLRSMIKSAELNETFIPNKPLHLKKWADTLNTVGAFTSDIDETTIIDIMMLNDVEDSWKILLLMGIGVFTNHPSITYTEIMKKLADQQKLYMIIGSSDYIYGTNYQFCHAYLSKDMKLTQEKIIQALGRVGRNNIQQNYSIRFRDDEQIHKLFYKEENKIEVANMNRLFKSVV
jgi:hypothetical protein